MKNICSWFLCIPFLCTPLISLADTAPAKESTICAPIRVPLGTQKQHKKKTGEKKQTKCFGPVHHSFNPFYYVKSIGADGGTLITTDETVWQISSTTAKTAQKWGENSMVVISPSSWYSKYAYYLTNTVTHERVNAKLSQGPFLQNAIFITQIDRASNTVSLSNGMGFHVVNKTNFASWEVGQAILLGVNDGWLGGKNLLVNVNENNYVTANRTF